MVLAFLFIGFIVAQVILLREARKLIRQTRHFAQVYFPQEHLAELADESRTGERPPTHVEIQKSWDEDRDGIL